MSLFADRHEADVERAAAFVAQAVRARGGVATPRARGGVAESFVRRGSALIRVVLDDSRSAPDSASIRVSADVAASRDELSIALCRRLLELNVDVLRGVAFGLRGRTIVICAERSVVDLDASEVDAIVDDVARLADRYDDELIAAFDLEWPTRVSEAQK